MCSPNCIANHHRGHVATRVGSAAGARGRTVRGRQRAVPRERPARSPRAAVRSDGAGPGSHQRSGQTNDGSAQHGAGDPRSPVGYLSRRPPFGCGDGEGTRAPRRVRLQMSEFGRRPVTPGNSRFTRSRQRTRRKSTSLPMVRAGGASIFDWSFLHSGHHLVLKFEIGTKKATHWVALASCYVRCTSSACTSQRGQKRRHRRRYPPQRVLRARQSSPWR